MEESPCKTCEHIKENKKTFPDCVNCIKRFPEGSCFLVAEGYKTTGFCKWPYGCSTKIVRADYCRVHSNIIGIRKRYWRDKDISEEKLQAKIFAPIRKRGRPCKNSLIK